MAKARDFYPAAEELYVRKGKTLEEIKAIIAVSTTTLTKWKKDGDWGRKRKDYLTRTRQGPAQRLRDKLFKLLEDAQDIDPKTVDSVSKIVAAIEKIEGGRDALGATIEVMDRFSQYLQKNEKDSAFLDRFTEHLHGFFSEVKARG